MTSDHLQETRQKIYGNFLRFGTSTGITMVLSLILKLYQPRVLGPEKIGVLYFAESFAALFFLFLSFGSHSYIAKKVPPNKEHAQEIFFTLFMTQIGFGIILQCILFLVLEALGHKEEMKWATLVMGLQFAVVMMQNNLFRVMFIATERYQLVAKVNIFTKVILVSSSMIVLAIYPNVVYLAICFFVSELIGMLVLLGFSYKHKIMIHRFNYHLLTQIMKVSAPFFLVGIFVDIYNYIDSTMITSLANAKEAGFYGAAYKLIGIGLMFVPIIESATMPSLSIAFKEDIKRYSNMLQELLRFILLVSFPAALAIVVFGDEATSILYGNKFERSASILAYLAPILMVIYINVFLAGGLRISTNGHKLAMVLCFTTLTNIMIKSMIIPLGMSTWGEGGAGLAAALGTVIAELMICILFLVITPHRSFGFRSVAQFSLAFAAVLFGALLHEKIAPISLVLKIPLFMIFTPIYALIIGLYTKAQAIQLIKTIFNRLRFS